ncbi:PTS mannose transporter subunit IID [Sporanaerobium hydrogeniformans]|uniref:PTS mannose transporter subunit IID n=1 Tax=Sporanaerobium hydrogeniformans TaxID=3072179 RepID=A0AC61DC00_9FIRM|nr:dihydroxyacetone kinase phosphoryl donor subunit DhaM [Sporanaerobium hydrogeniformans]PHV70563.1 PTS mannose transporter subunit IID [Sporanaerobium hydrogeniformans]
MVGLVIVSHSRMLAEGVVELAYEMADKALHIIPAGGLEDGSIGTDALRIMEALLVADTGDGVLVLGDMGSSILSTQIAIDLLEDEALKQRVKISHASLVEGAIIAAIQASIGDPLDEVFNATLQVSSFSKL